MKLKRKMIYGLLITSCLLTLPSCSQSGSALAANELYFDLNNISDITISYDDETITFFESDENKLIIKEYMTENKRNYYANVKQNNRSIQIREGEKPFFKGHFSRHIEVYLPKEYHENLTVTTTDGNIIMSDIILELDSLRIDTTAGTVQLDKTNASIIHLSSTSGKVNCTELNGAVSYTTTKGDIDVKSAVGSGSYRADNSGQLKVNYTKVTGDLSFFNKNDSIELTLPKELEFIFEATTKNGSVTTSFQESIRVNGRISSGTVGRTPTATVKAETNNGDIQVTQ